MVQPNSTSFAACETVNPAAASCHCRPRHAQLIRVDPCHPWFQNAIHQRSDELDVNPRSVVSSSANDQNQPVAAEDFPCERSSSATRLHFFVRPRLLCFYHQSEIGHGPTSPASSQFARARSIAIWFLRSVVLGSSQRDSRMNASRATVGSRHR